MSIPLRVSPLRDLFEGLAFALGAGCGLTLALVLMASIREETELAAAHDRPGHGSRSDRRRQPLPRLHGLRRPAERVVMEILAPLLLAVLFVVFGLSQRGRSGCDGCGKGTVCPGKPGCPQHRDDPKR